VHVAVNRPENHSFKGCFWHPLRLSRPRPCAVLRDKKRSAKVGRA
jgi:hypothetical protein